MENVSHSTTPIATFDYFQTQAASLFSLVY